MIELIATIIFLVSLCGIAVILYRKVPVLAQLSNAKGRGTKRNFISETESIISDFYSVFLKQKLLHKSLSWLRIIALRTEAKLDSLLRNLRKPK
jgi:hypothetical protein